MMPYRAVVACARPGCRGVINNGVCSVCGDQRKRKQEDTDARRGTAAQRGYGHRWRKLRYAYLSAHPLCVQCGAPATDVDHILPRRQGGSDEKENLQALCHGCHAKKTLRER